MDFTGDCSDFKDLLLYHSATQSNLHVSTIQHTQMSQDDVAYLDSTRERQLTELAPMAPIIPQINTSLTLTTKSIVADPESIHNIDKVESIEVITKPQIINSVFTTKSSTRPTLTRLQPNTNLLVQTHEYIPNTQQLVQSQPNAPKSVQSFHFVRMASLLPTCSPTIHQNVLDRVSRTAASPKYCTVQFLTKDELDVHLTREHHRTIPNRFYGSNGIVEFKSEHSLQDHLHKEHDHKMFVCPVDGCGKAFKNRSDCTRHARIDGRPFQCTWPNCYYQGAKDRTTALNHIRGVHFKIDVRAPGAKTSKYRDPKAYLKVIQELL